MILGVTTATPRCTVALVEGDDVLAVAAYEDEKNHAERLFPTLDTLFANAGRRRDELELIACDVGPGSFTGVRVGLSSAKGIALGLGVPLLGVGSLEAMCSAALGHAPEATIACALLDAKRGETFVAAFDRRGHQLVAPCHVRIGEAAAAVTSALTAAGVGSEGVVFCGRAAERENVSPIVHHGDCELPHATTIARLVAGRPEAERALARQHTLEPVYVRAPDAKPMAALGAPDA